MAQHFTNQTADGDSVVETVTGGNTVHVTGTLGCACLIFYGGPEGGSEFNNLLNVKYPQAFNFDFSGDIYFSLSNAKPSTNISVSVEPIS